MRPRRVGFLFDGAAEVYGLRAAAANLVAALDRDRVTPVGVFLSHGEAEADLAPRCDEVAYCEAGSMPRTRSAANESRGVGGGIRLSTHIAAGVRRLVPLIKARRLDAIHSHYWHTFLIGGAAARICGIASIWHLHGGYPHRGMSDWLWREAGRALADRVFCISRWVKRTLPDEWQPRARVLYNGLPAGAMRRGALRGKFRQRFGIPDDAKLVGAFGGILDRKGFEFFAEAAVRLLAGKHALPTAKSLYFALVGDALPGNRGSQESAELLRLAIDVEPVRNRFIFTGRLPDAWRYMCDFDIVVSPTVPLPGDPTPDFGEGFGMVIAEAMVQGVATIATDRGASPELVESGESGLLVPPRDSFALADAIRLLVTDDDLRKRLGAAGAERVASRFDASIVAQAAADLYEDLIPAE